MSTLKNPDVVELTQELVRIQTTSDLNNERLLLDKLAAILEAHGFSCAFSNYDPKNPTRQSLVAQLNPDAREPALCFGGHIDTVPFGEAPWVDEPLAAVVKDGKLYGRGSADMKGGAAAMTCACLAMAPKMNGRNLILHFYGGEERGLLGSNQLAQKEPERMGNIGAVIVTEPSSNLPQMGHKGVLWVYFRTKGVTAHASMSYLGDNALHKILPTANRLKDFQPADKHPWLGQSTAVLATLHSGLNTNSVPDSALMTLDIRTIAGQDIDGLVKQLKALCDPEVTLETQDSAGTLWTDPELPWSRKVREIAGKVLGREIGVETAIFATDGAALRYALPEAPIIVLGPGDPGMAHKTDEFVPVQDLRNAQTIYEQLIQAWNEQ